MTNKEQHRRFLRDYLAARKTYKDVASYADEAAANSLHALGGMALSWRTDLSECTYYYPVRIDGRMVDLSNFNAVQAFNDTQPLLIQTIHTSP